MEKTKSVSVVAPVFNEQGNLQEFYEQVKAQFESIQREFELIFVDDGSFDDSLSLLKRLSTEDPRVKVISLSRNFGHQIAVTAGLECSTCEAVITMDADLQHPPELIPQLIAKWEEGFDVVNAVREKTQRARIFKRASSRIFYGLMSRVSRTPITAGVADFRLLDRRIVKCLCGMKERSRFLRGMVGWLGFRQTGVSYVAKPRHTGKSKYSLSKMLGFGVDGITGFSSFPLRIATYLGFLAAVIGLPYGVWAVYVRLYTDTTEPGWASLVVLILFLGGVQLICLGIIGEYINRIYEEVKGRPLYLVQETIGFGHSEADTDSADKEPAESSDAQAPKDSDTE